MSLPQHFDYIIAGSGCAGLSLVFYLLQTPLQEKKILLIDKDLKVSNDRTWCFWEKEENPFEEIVHKSWKNVHFHGSNFSKLLDLSPYQYKMIRSIDFYQFVHKKIANSENLQFLQGQVQKLEDTSNGAKVIVDEKTYTAKWIFNSIPAPEEPRQFPHYHLLQHFKGWIIETEQAIFQPDMATLMDFRIKQHNDTRFMYVLPTHENLALVEFTVFSPTLLEKAVYDVELKNYLNTFMKIGRYKILHEEFGIIPMTNHLFPAKQGSYIINLGTAGGQTKPSTGYTFIRIQKQTRQIVQNLLYGKIPVSEEASKKSRFWWYDSILLNVLLKNRCSGKKVFTHLFKQNNIDTILAFLDEETNLFQELKIAYSVPSLPFLKASIDLLRGS